MYVYIHMYVLYDAPAFEERVRVRVRVRGGMCVVHRCDVVCTCV